MRPVNRECPDFFLTINHHPWAIYWFSDTPMGVNRIGDMIHKICMDAKLEGNFTTLFGELCAHNLLNSHEFDIVSIAQLSGHKNPNSLQYYLAATHETQKKTCTVLQRPGPKPTSTISNAPNELALPNTAHVQTCEEVASDCPPSTQALSVSQVSRPVTTSDVNFEPPSKFHRFPSSTDIARVPSATESNNTMSMSQQHSMLQGTFAGAHFHGGGKYHLQQRPTVGYSSFNDHSIYLCKIHFWLPMTIFQFCMEHWELILTVGPWYIHRISNLSTPVCWRLCGYPIGQGSFLSSCGPCTKEKIEFKSNLNFTQKILTYCSIEMCFLVNDQEIYCE